MNLVVDPARWFTFSHAVRSCDGNSRCGDAVLVQRLAEDRLACVLVDVSGHGARCAPASSHVSTRLLAMLLAGFSPRDSAFFVDCDPWFRRSDDEAAFVTAFVAVIDAAAGTVTYSAAGHDGALLVGSDGTTSSLDANGPALGVVDRPVFGEGVVTFQPGDRLVVVTDGITESRTAGGPMFGLEGVGRIARRQAVMPNAATIVAAAEHHARGTLRDDASAVVVESRPAFGATCVASGRGGSGSAPIAVVSQRRANRRSASARITRSANQRIAMIPGE